ncbi:hypothetical protein BCR39DRAFT_530978 [Naematelia encephala]|uniref:Ig-like domain-containing protein n=1 Tax=Naematelia encephala TaxID=71784 RepID=A0A1Y2B5L5_9TREE|nr:hypothetical protein BCR39DRAFT_530978 [Naematelia encephala]
MHFQWFRNGNPFVRTNSLESALSCPSVTSTTPLSASSNMTLAETVRESRVRGYSTCTASRKGS